MPELKFICKLPCSIEIEPSSMRALSHPVKTLDRVLTFISCSSLQQLIPYVEEDGSKNEDRAGPPRFASDERREIAEVNKVSPRVFRFGFPGRNQSLVWLRSIVWFTDYMKFFLTNSAYGAYSWELKAEFRLESGRAIQNSE